MTFQQLDIYVGAGLLDDPGQQRHWVLILTPRDSAGNCTFYHVKGGPANYMHSIQAGQTLYDPRIKFLDHIGTIPATEQKTVYELSRWIPACRCHMYIVAILVELEGLGLIAPGLSAFYHSQVNASLFQQSILELRMDELSVATALVDISNAIMVSARTNLEVCTCFF
ncbi:hypothetical protein BJX99DRAFT_255314 [Aspergillus californicus]